MGGTVVAGIGVLGALWIIYQLLLARKKPARVAVISSLAQIVFLLLLARRLSTDALAQWTWLAAAAALAIAAGLTVIGWSHLSVHARKRSQTITNVTVAILSIGLSVALLA